MNSYTWRAAVLRSGLEPTTRHVLLTLSCHINDAGESAYPSTRLLAFESGLSERSVCTHLEKAVLGGWLRRRQHGLAGQKWKRNEYFPRLPDGFIPATFETDFLPEGTERSDKKALKDVQQLDEKALNVVPEGTERDDKKALKDVQCNYSYELPIELLTPVSAKKSLTSEKENDVDMKFEEVWAMYPKRAGSSSKTAARKAWNARLKSGVTADAMIAGVKGYAKQVRDESNEGTRFVKMASTFLGPDQHFASTGESGDNSSRQDLAAGRWWCRAGFEFEYEAINAGCSEKYAHLWRDGARIATGEAA
jgi:hypothetical protein